MGSALQYINLKMNLNDHLKLALLQATMIMQQYLSKQVLPQELEQDYRSGTSPVLTPQSDRITSTSHWKSEDSS